MPSPPKRAADVSAPKLRTLLAKAGKAVEKVDLASIAATGLCLSDFAVLEVLLHKGPLPVNTIGAKVNLTSGSISTAIDRLQERKLVARAVDPGDRRVCHVRLTPAGHRLISKAYTAHERNLEAALKPLSRQEKNELGRLLKKLGFAAVAHHEKNNSQ